MQTFFTFRFSILFLYSAQFFHYDSEYLMIQYYLFLQKIQFAIVARFLLFIVPLSVFTEVLYYLAKFLSNFIPKDIAGFLSVIFGFFIVFVLYIYSVIYVFRNISFKDYAIYRTGKISDDIGFATIYSILIGMVSLPLILIDFQLYKIFSVYFIQIAALYLLFNRKIHSYSVEKRDQPLKT